MDLIQAVNYVASLPRIYARDRWSGRGDDTRWVVLHSIESSELPNTAESLGYYFANPGNRTASTQAGVDNNSTVIYAELDEVVAGARGANHKGIHIEQAGVAAQGWNEWRDAYSMQMIKTQTAPLVAALCLIYDIPPVFLKADALLAGAKGITTHSEVWRAFGGDVRTDPGANYPLPELLEEVKIILGEDDMPLTEQDIQKIADRVCENLANTRGEKAREEIAKKAHYVISGWAKLQGQPWAQEPIPTLNDITTFSKAMVNLLTQLGRKLGARLSVNLSASDWDPNDPKNQW